MLGRWRHGAEHGPRSCSLCRRLAVNVHSLAADCKLPSASAVHFPAYLVVQFAVHAAWRRGADETHTLHAMDATPINTAFTDKEAASYCVRVVHIAACLVVRFSLSSSTTGTLIDKRACLFLFVRVRVCVCVCVCARVRAWQGFVTRRGVKTSSTITSYCRMLITYLRGLAPSAVDVDALDG